MWTLLTLAVVLLAAGVPLPATASAHTLTKAESATDAWLALSDYADYDEYAAGGEWNETTY
jgi:hypothetical protein